MAACAQCRQRKVRCQGGPSTCDACTRLGFQCSLSRPANPTSGSETIPVVARKRGVRACDACRAQRSRCSGHTPSCLRCQQFSIPCHYALSIRQYRVRERGRMSAASIEDQISPEWRSGDENAKYSAPTNRDENVANPATCTSELLDRFLRCEKAVVRRHIDAYFEHIYPIPLFSFLHRADFLSHYASGDLPLALLLAVCVIASRFVSSSGQRHESKSWIELAETMVFQRIGKTTIADIQALMILALCRGQNNQNSKAFLYLALAVRMAYSIKLHKEDTRLPFIEQECRRRLLWCIFTMDRLHAGGVPEYILLPIKTVQVQLPCKEHYFEADVVVETPHIHEKQAVNSELTVSAFLVRLFDIRSRILQYTKQLLDASISPEASLTQFQAFEEELKSIRTSLPAELLFSVRAFQLRAFSAERTTFLIFHLWYHHCHCELYRLLNPGYREALPQSVIYATSPDLVAYAQSNCLEHAIAIGEIIASTHQIVETEPYVCDIACFVLSYQASCAILYACHRDSPAYTMKAETARKYFTTFIQTLERLLKFFPTFVIFVKDIRNMLRSIDDPNAPLPVQKASTEVDFRARPVEESSEEDNAANLFQGLTPNSDKMTRSIDPQASAPDMKASSGTEGLYLQTPSPFEHEFPLGPYVGESQNEIDSLRDFDEELLWDWADALGTGFSA